MMSHSKQKRYLCAATAIAVLASAFGCSPVQEGDSSAPAKQSWLQIVNSYEEDKTMLIGAHGEPEPTLEAYRTAAEMGLNFTFLVENKDNPSVYDLAEPSRNEGNSKYGKYAFLVQRHGLVGRLVSIFFGVCGGLF